MGHTLENTGHNQHLILQSHQHYSLLPPLSFPLLSQLGLLVTYHIAPDGPKEIITIYFLYSTHITLVYKKVFLSLK